MKVRCVMSVAEVIQISGMGRHSLLLTKRELCVLGFSFRCLVSV